MKISKKLIALIMVLIIVICAVPVNAETFSEQYPPKGYGTLHTYTIWDGIRWGGNCRKLINFTKEHNALSDSYGIVTYGSYFAGALTSTYGKVGDMLLVVTEGNIVYPVIMADTKNQSDPGCNKWGHQNGRCIVEFEILSSCRRSLYGTSGGYISDILSKPIVKVINLGSVFNSTRYFWNPELACVESGLEGYLLLKNPYEGELIVDKRPNVTVNNNIKFTENTAQQVDKPFLSNIFEWIYDFIA